MENCLINMIKLSDVLEKPADEYKTALKNLNSNSVYFKRLNKSEAYLNDLIAKNTES